MGQVTMTLNQADVERAERVSQRIKTRTKGGAVTAALSLADMLTRSIVEDGAEVYVVSRDGGRSKLSIIKDK